MQRINAQTGGIVLCLALLGVPILADCDRICGGTITVVFRSADGVRGGESVYLGGVQVGKTGSPKVVDGKARVPVRLFPRHRQALTPATIFILKEDPSRSDRVCLVGHALAKGGAGDEVEKNVYLGVRNEGELIFLIGASAAEGLLERMKDWIPSED